MNILDIKISRLPIMENVNITYQVMGRQETSHKIIFMKNNFKDLQTHCILKTLWYITSIFRRKIIENYPKLSKVDYLIGDLSEQHQMR